MELVDAIGEVNGDCGLDYNDWIRIGFFDLANHFSMDEVSKVLSLG